MEMVVTLAIMAILVAAVAPQIAAVNAKWQTKQDAFALTQNARVMLDHITRNLSQAREITAVTDAEASLGSITFTDADGRENSYQLQDGTVYYNDGSSDEPLAENIQSFSLQCYKAQGLSQTAEPSDVRYIEVDVNIQPDDLETGRTFSTAILLMNDKLIEDQGGDDGDGGGDGDDGDEGDDNNDPAGPFWDEIFDGLLVGGQSVSYVLYSQTRVTIGWKAKVMGNTAAMGNITLDSEAVVDGDIYSTETVSLGWRASYGEVHENLGSAAFYDLTLPSFYDTPSEQSDIDVDSKDTLSLDPGTYGDVYVDWKSKLNLSAGTYYFDKLTLDSKTEINADTSAGEVIIYVAGKTDFGWKSEVNRQGGSEVVFISAGKINTNEADLDATLICADQIILTWKTDVKGKVWASGKVQVDGRATIDPGSN